MSRSNRSSNTESGVAFGGFQNVSQNKGKSLTSSEKSALSSLNEFLKILHTSCPEQHPHDSLDTLSNEELLTFREVFGRFPDYLLRVKKIKENTAKSYLSQARKLVNVKCESSDIMNERWYKTLRRETCKSFTAHHKATNTKKSNAAPPMSSDDLSRLCNILFARNTVNSTQERALLVLQWQALGRVSETTALTYPSLGWHSRYDCLSVVMNREKVDLEHTIHCFLHSNNWLICPLHALGTYLF